MLAALLSLACVFHSVGADWPQYRGATHDGVVTDRITTNWTGAITNPVWRVVVPNSLSSLTVSGGRVFTQTRRQRLGVETEFCVALNATNGAELWAAPIDVASYPEGGVGDDNGPRTTPAIYNGSAYVASSYFKLYRLNAANGSTNWLRDLVSLYNARSIQYQNCASPVIENDLIFLNANTGASTLMALRTSDGSIAWRSQSEPMTHSTPVVTTISGVRQVIFATQNGLVSVDAQSGNLLWKFNYPFAYSTSIGASPVAYQDTVFITGAHAYEMGSVAIRATLTNNAWSATQLWFTNNPAAHWMTPVAYQGFLFGHFGIQSADSPTAQLKCVDMRTGLVKWSANNFGRSGLLLVNDNLLSITERGQLVLVKANTNAYTEVGRFQAIPGFDAFTNKCWNVPAVADGRVYVRSTAYVASFDLSLPALKLDLPEVNASNVQLTVRTVNGAAIALNRLAGMEVRVGTNAAQPVGQWTKLSAAPVLTNGTVRFTNPAGTEPQRVFIVSEPQ